MKKLHCIMLIDDNRDDNFFHERVIKKNDVAEIVIAQQSATDALAYLMSKNENKTPHPDLIFLDINMPGMNGWEFLQEYNTLDKQLQSKAIVVMLTTSENPDDHVKANGINVISDFKIKPLTREILEEIIDKHFGTL